MFSIMRRQMAHASDAACEHDRADAVRVRRGEIGQDHCAVGGADADRMGDAERVHETPRQRAVIARRRKRHQFELAETRHVPGDQAVATGEGIELRLPRRGIAAESVQEQERRPSMVRNFAAPDILVRLVLLALGVGDLDQLLRRFAVLLQERDETGR